MRREVLIIIGITALVVTLVLLLGPQLAGSRGNDTSTADRRQQLAPPTNQPSNEPVPAPVQVVPKPALLKLRPVDALTGKLLEDARAEIHWRFNDRQLARQEVYPSVGGIEVTLEEGQVQVWVRCYGYEPWYSGVVELSGGDTHNIGDVPLSPLFPVQIWPSETGVNAGKLVITRLWPPPALPANAPVETVTYLSAGREIQLPPGKYLCRVPLELPQPYDVKFEWPDYRYEPTFEFEVIDQRLTLTPVLEARPGPITLRAEVRNAAGEVPRPAWVWVVAHEPLMPDCVVAAKLSDENGVVTFEGLHPGSVTLVAGREQYADLPGAVAKLELGNSPEPVELSIREHAWDGQTTLQTTGRLEVQVTKHGVPLPDVQLIDHDAASKWWPPQDDGKPKFISDAAGRVIVEEATAGTRRHRLNLLTYRLFEFEVVPGGTTYGEIELCPNGTTIVRGKLDMERKRISVVTLFGEENEFRLTYTDFAVDERCEFVVWDAPEGLLRLEARIDRDYEVSFGINVPPGPEFEWKSSLKQQFVEADLPAWEAGEERVHFAIADTPDGMTFSDLYPSEFTLEGNRLTVRGIRPGVHRLRLYRGATLWTSEPFTIVDEPASVSTWTQSDRSTLYPQTERPPSRYFIVNARIAADSLPPWCQSLTASYTAGRGEEVFDSGELFDRGRAKATGGGRAVYFSGRIHADSDWLELRVHGMEPVKLPLPPAPEDKRQATELETSLQPAQASRLIYLDAHAALAKSATWKMRLSYGDARWLQLDSRAELPLGERPWDRRTSGITLVTWNGRPALWLPNLPADANTLTLRVPGFEDASVDLDPEAPGYRELTCSLKPK